MEEKYNLIIRALHNAQNLIYNELDCIDDDYLYKEYMQVLESINAALEELK